MDPRITRMLLRLLAAAIITIIALIAAFASLHGVGAAPSMGRVTDTPPPVPTWTPYGWPTETPVPTATTGAYPPPTVPTPTTGAYPPPAAAPAKPTKPSGDKPQWCVRGVCSPDWVIKVSKWLGGL